MQRDDSPGSSSSSHARPGKQQSQLMNLQTTSAGMAEVMSRIKGNGFAARYYAPFFVAMQNEMLTAAFVSRTFRQAHLSGADEWATQNDAELKKYDAWLAAYHWPPYK